MKKYFEKKLELIKNELNEVQIEFDEMSLEQVQSIQKEWIEYFTNNQRKSNLHNLWNDLNNMTMTKLHLNEDAQVEYEKLFGSEFIIFDDRPVFGLYCYGKGKTMPKWNSIDFDLYIVNKNFNWSFILTHDMPYSGPFFFKK